MPKLDSFMKETLRLYPLQFANFQRKVLKPFSLSTGQLIPASTVIEVPTMAVSLDASRFPHPHRFDPWRFWRLRTAPGADPTGHQFATVAADGTNFGWGRHACPGRWFAANEIKMLAGPMDPISAFSLAAAVAQIVDYGTRILSDTYEISGRTARDVELSTISQDLSDLSKQLEVQLDNVEKPSKSALLDVCKRCVDASDDVQNAADTLRAKRTRTRVSASTFVSALKSIWTEAEVERLRDSLTEIREETKQDGQRGVELRNRLGELAEKLDGPARALATDLKEMTFLHEPVQLSRKNRELIRIIQHTDWAFWAPNEGGQPFNVPRPVGKLSNDDVSVAAKILSTLPFRDMDSREKAIANVYPDTFEWIFRDGQADKQGRELQWTRFPSWLRDTSESIYWITGEAGSGKSTLMKFIFEHPQLRHHLQENAKELPLMLAGFFFCNPGSNMQKSQEGLLRTLLHQCLNVRQDLIPVVFPRRWALYKLLGSDAICPGWSRSELEERFDTFSSLNGKEFRLALVVDGLDEFEGDHKALIQWAKDHIACRGIKLCVSSRPWNLFSDMFVQAHSLTMQDLSRRDIEHFVTTEFNNCPTFQNLKRLFQDESNRLLSGIVSKAEGVFLWAILVVRYLLETLTDNPSLPHTQAQLAAIPTDIMGLYTFIWRSIPPERIPMSSKLFLLCIFQNPNVRKVTAETFWLAAQDNHARSRATVMDDSARHGIANVMEQLLNGHTRGLLEISADQVRYLHRSVRDWTLDGVILKEMCSKAPKDFEPCLHILEAFLAQPPRRVSDASDLFQLATFCLSYAGLALAQSSSSSSTKNAPRHDRIVHALDRANALACDLSVAASAQGSIIPPRDLHVDSAHPDADGFSRGHWAALHHHPRIEDSFVGVAAQCGVFEYVRAKVAADEKLLEPKRDRVSLLESAVFPGLASMRLRGEVAPFGIRPSPLRDRDRLRVVRFLLDSSRRVRYRTAGDESLYDVLVEARREEELFPGLRAWYDQVLPLLERYGYGPEESDGRGAEKSTMARFN
ncbi:hypothetical protein SLS55_003889 [Diplodia seriata]|uniref:Nephrocystin 3-like N-terminal domain-containing protein n=1 Tax=Diplodia seriata TaxID=420778 RepID=A0ABR3CJ18_9PEZI